MTTLYFKLENQMLSLLNQEVIASGDSNTDKCAFDFSGDWDGYIKTAVFYQDKRTASYAVLNSDDTCLVPAAAMASEGDMFVGVFGVRGNEILTSTVKAVYIAEGATSGVKIDVEPSDDIFLALIAQYQSIAEQMAYHNRAADEIRDLAAAQNRRLEELNAFDVLEMAATVRGLQESITSHEERISGLEGTVFVLWNQEIRFTSKTLRLEDSRVKKDSLADFYFDTDSFAGATEAEIDGETCSGYIQLTCEYVPEYPLRATIVVRRRG